MIDRNVFSHNAQEPETCRLEACIDACREHVNHILSEVSSSQYQEAHKVEASLCKQLMQLGFLLLALFFVNYHDGDYGETTSLAPLDMTYFMRDRDRCQEELERVRWEFQLRKDKVQRGMPVRRPEKRFK